MSRTNAILLALGTLVLGLAIGAFAGTWFSATVFSGLTSMSVASNAAIRVRTLEGLRRNETVATTELMESMLDGDLIALSAFLNERPADVDALESVRRAKVYRNRYPRTNSDAAVEATIQSAFRRVEESAK